MADTDVDAGAPNLNLTADEKRVFRQLFQEADTENIGVVTGEVAVKFFERTRLDPRILGEIWQIADKENRGLLTPAGFSIVLRLIGHYQAGRDPTPELAFRPAPTPKFDGLQPQLTGTPAPAPIQPQNSGNLIRVPPLTADKVAQYTSLFEKSGADGGILPGEQAKTIFERAGLPNETLGRIWNLADTEQKGALSLTEFIIAMHLLASCKSGAMRALPSVLPAGLYEAAARRGPVARQMSGSMPAVPPIPRQVSGANAARTSSPLSRPGFGPAGLSSQTIGGNWAVSPADKARFDTLYATLDKTNRGFITGDEAVPFFSNSKLPEEVLAQIWDLADINSAGCLTRDEFAVAMYLIKQQRSKRDGRDTVPATLPPDLVPPSMRNQVRPPPQPTAPAFDAAPPPTIPKSAADDLFGLDAMATPSPPAIPPLQPLSTGGSAAFDPFGSNKGPATPSSPTVLAPHATGSSSFKPFIPSSSFGQSLTTHSTGASTPSIQPTRTGPARSSTMDDLLGDNDPEVSKKLTNETSELANLSNQVSSLSKQMQEVQGQRASTQNELTSASSQKREWQGRLAQLRTLYEQEAKDVRSLQEQLQKSKDETTKIQQELAMVEGAHADLQTQHQQVASALQADQQENANLKERIRALNAEITQLKPQLEKLRSDARQQKGLVAINKKQLLTNEGERDKLKAEAEELTKSIEEDKKTLEEGLAQAERAQSPPVTSPTGSVMSANNPFFKRQGSTNEASFSPFPPSPATAPQGAQSFENIFGPTLETAVANPLPSTPMPPTTFRSASPEAIRNSSPSPAPSALSVSQSAHGMAVPPPPAMSRQISSSYLPFPHEDDTTSSRQVSAPASRFGDDGTATESGATATADSTVEVSSPVPDRNLSASPAASEAKSAVSGAGAGMPGSFPGEASSSAFSDKSSSVVVVDPFAASGSKDQQKPVGKDDFDAAFAGLGGSASSQSKKADPAISRVHQEFPPLEEIEDDDDSSASEAGFEDDFAPPLEPRKDGVASAAPSTLGVPAEATTASAASSINHANPPAEDAQLSPPAYESAVSPGQRAHAEVQEFDGLLPSREDPTHSSVPFSVPSATSGQGGALFNNSNEAAATTSQEKQVVAAPAQPAVPPKNAFDDFDDFDDLEDAKEGDLDDDFANISVHDRSNLDDFNQMFDSPAESKSSNAGAFGNSNGFTFAHSPSTSLSGPPATASTAGNTQDEHDWDAIFAGIDKPGAAGSQGDALAAFDFGNGNGTSSTTTKAPERPEIGRALTQGGEHDDPILKNLTGMGYSRQDALAALEKYDYNLERAADYLAGQS